MFLKLTEMTLSYLSRIVLFVGEWDSGDVDKSSIMRRFV
jgi:hypothetical protein